MARQLRVEFHGALYHVLSRGNERNLIFRNDSDRDLFIKTLEESAELAGVEVIAYVLMDNHYHLIIGTPNSNLSHFMRHFGLTYTVRFNKRHARSGHLFQGRFKAVLIEEDPYLMVLSRYIHLNPVRTERWADTRAEEKWRYLKSYPWSTLPGYIDERKKLNWIRYEKVENYFGRDKVISRAAYKRYVMEGLKSSLSNPFDEVKSQTILGSEEFVERIRNYLHRGAKVRELPALRSLRKVQTIEDVLTGVAGYFHIEREKLVSKGGKELRQIAMEMAYRHTGCNQEEIGRAFGVDYSTVSQNRRRLGVRLKGDRKLMESFERVSEKLINLSNQKI
jgi:putative transposase